MDKIGNSMGSVYTVKQFARAFGLSEEYVRQACRGQSIGSSGNIASLYPGWKAHRSGKRWFITRDDENGNETSQVLRSSQFSETAAIDGLVADWHEKAIFRSKAQHEHEPKPLDQKVLLSLRNAYLEAVESGRIDCTLRFARDGSCKVSFSGARPLYRMIVLEIFLREDEKRIRDLQGHFLNAWNSEYEDTRQGKPREPRTIPFGAQPSESTRHEFHRRCLNCGKRHKRKVGTRFCNHKCADTHRKWIQRLPKDMNERLMSMRKRLATKVLINL